MSYIDTIIKWEVESLFVISYANVIHYGVEKMAFYSLIITN